MTISGMTGFARVEGALGAWTWAVEARSVNRRGLEVRFRGPPGFDGLERGAREAAQARFQRGQMGSASRRGGPRAGGQSQVDVAVLEGYLALGESLVAAGRAAPPTMDGLLALRGVIETGDDDDAPEARAAIEAAMAASIVQALEGLEDGAAGGRRAPWPA